MLCGSRLVAVHHQNGRIKVPYRIVSRIRLLVEYLADLRECLNADYTFNRKVRVVGFGQLVRGKSWGLDVKLLTRSPIL